MNIYEKILKVRVGIIKAGLRMTGKNSYSGYSYFDLGDIVPVLETLCDEYGLFTIVSHGSEQSSLTLINTEKPDEVVEIVSPTSIAKLKGAHEVQNLGAVQTYLRRYLYMTAFNIVEHDALDATQGKEQSIKNGANKPPAMPPEKPEPITKEQTDRIFAYCKQLSELEARPVNEILVEIEAGYKSRISDMTSKQGINLAKQLVQRLNNPQRKTV